MKKILLGVLFFSCLLTGIAYSETLTLTKVAEYGTGYYLDVFVQGNYAYCAASGNGLDIINISTPASPAFVANCDTPGEANGVYVSGNYAYVADGEGGLSIINITTPASPVLAGTYNTPGTAGGVFVSGSYAYVADGDNGLLIVNITTPASPSLTGSYNTTGNAWDVFISGNTAYVADGLSGVQIINVTTPASPSLLGTFSTAGSTGGARGIWISGVYAYVAYWDKGLRIFDVTDPAAVVAQGFIDQTWEAWGVQVSGSYAYVAGDGNDFQIINITLPATPSVTALIDTGGWAKAVYVSGSYVYMADYHRGLQVFNVTTPASPALAANYDFSSEQRSVFVSGNYAYTASLRDGLKIFNITTPSAPVFVGGLEYAAEGEATGIYVSGNLAYLSYDTSGLHIIDVSDPALPALVGQIDTPGNATDVFVSGSYAYVSDYDSGLQIINVSSPSSPTIAGTFNTAGSAWSVAVNGNYAYVADGPEGLQIINITTPSSPTLAGTYNTDGDAVGVFISGSYAYVGDYYYGLQIINIANPSIPGLVGSYDTLGYARRVFVSGHYAFVPDWDYGLAAINVANPGIPTLAATYDTPGFAWKAFVAGDYAYLADGSSGKLFVLDVGITLTVSGTVTRGGVGLEGVVMNGLPGNPATNASGVYTATVDSGFSGTVTPTYSGNVFIPASRTYSGITADQTGQDYVAGYTVSGTVTRGGLGLENVVMSGLPGNPATNSSGVYSVTVTHGFSGTVTPTLAGNSFTPPTRNYSNVTAHQTDQDYTAALLTYTISGTVTAGAAGLQNVVMSGLPGSPVTNASGYYEATVNYGFSGTATPTLAGYAFTPPTRTYSNVTSAQSGQNYTATLNTLTISGTVTAGGVGLQGVILSGLPGSPATNSSGVYTATVDYGFSGTATPTLAGYSFAPPSRAYSNVTTDQTAQDYTASTVTLTISGTVTEGATGLQGVVMNGLPGNPATDASGVYTSTVSYGFSGTVTPTLTSYTFTPPSRTYSSVISNQTDQNYTATLVPAPVIVLSRSRLNFGATSALKTIDQKFIISNGGGRTLDWSITDDADWLSSSSASGTGEAEITVSVDQTGLAAGTYNAAITVSSTTATNSPQTVNITLVVIPAASVGNPAGAFDTPADGTTGITGAIAVTGWALDDIEVTKVEIKRDPAATDPAGAIGADGLVFIGDAVFVDDARPDVEQAFSASPLNYRAGWGYMLLTYGLPNQGNGSYRLHAIMYDKDGHRVSLGAKTIQVDNANAVNPFGTIDTPNQGGTVSGTYPNFGWALTPMPSEIPKDGSTISVYIDGVYLGHPVYNLYRADIATSFPGYNNSDGAVGLYNIDTTQYTNRVHTIGWLVTDNNGHADGIGSRFFTVFNEGSPNPPAQSAGIQGLRTALSPEEILRLPATAPAVQFRQGASSAERWQLGRMNREGAQAVQMREVERVEVQLGQRGRMLGFLVVGKDLRPLPAGSTLDRRSGTFYWQPGPGFKGDFDFVFIGEDEDGRPVKTALTVTIGPKARVN